MRISRKLVGIAAAGALIAGVGVATAAPASAAKTIGTTTITMDPTLLGKLQSQGIVVTGGDGANSSTAYSWDAAARKSTTTGTTVNIPIAKKGSGTKNADGSINVAHNGQVDIMNLTTAAVGKLGATCDNPKLTYKGKTPIALWCLVPMGTAPTEYADVFAISGGKVKTKNGKTTLTGTLKLNGVTYTAAFNQLLTGKATSGLFTDGETFGTIKATWTS